MVLNVAFMGEIEQVSCRKDSGSLLQRRQIAEDSLTAFRADTVTDLVMKLSQVGILAVDGPGRAAPGANFDELIFVIDFACRCHGRI